MMQEFKMKLHQNYMRKVGVKDYTTNYRELFGWYENNLASSIDDSKPALVVACMGQSMCTRLLIESILATKEFETIAYLIVVDSSTEDYTQEFVMKYFEKYAGCLVRVKVKTAHSEALDLAHALGLFKKVKYLQFLDNDVQVLQRGLGERIIKDMNAAKPYADIGGRYLGMRACKYYGEPWMSPEVCSTGFVMRQDYWDKKEDQDGCSIRVDLENKVYHDTWSYMLGTNPKAKFAAVDYIPQYIRHWGNITCLRHKGKKVPDYIETRYRRMRQRLLDLGVPSSEIHDDRVEGWG